MMECSLSHYILKELIMQVNDIDFFIFVFFGFGFGFGFFLFFIFEKKTVEFF